MAQHLHRTTPTAMGMIVGLTTLEAAERLAAVGPNRFVESRRWERVRDLVASIADPMAIMLVVAGSVYLGLGDTIDGTILLLALIPVWGVDVVLGARSRRALTALRASVEPRARVIRDGAEQTISTEAIVPGDVVVVREGEAVHADARVEVEQNLTVDEAHLTGESEPQLRVVGDTIYAGSRVVAGRASAVVIATGRHTAFGAIAALVANTEAGSSPLQRSVGTLVKRLGVAAVAIAIAMFGLSLGTGSSVVKAFGSAISLAMAAIPEEFPLVLTLFLSLGAVRLARRGVLVRRLSSVEALGATTVICVDKTGTLTEGSFELAAQRVLGGEDAGLCTAAVLACEVSPDDAMERLIVAHAATHGIVAAELYATWRLAIDHPFEREGKHMTHVWQAGDRWKVVMKGALEGVLEHCALAPHDRVAAEHAMAELGSLGMRVLAVAARDGTGHVPTERADAERELHLLGLLGFRDPLRAEVPAAIAACRAAGIRVKVITGDHVLTARVIAELAGLEVGPNGVITGPALAALPAAERARQIHDGIVFARVRPEQKHEIVDTLVTAGEVVAMTGDGINDAPALRRASIGVSMGPGATEVARAAAGLVLLDNDFSALVGTVREGRRIYANLQRAFLFLVGFHVPIIGLAIAAPVLGLPLLLLPIHLVWLELVVHPVAALVFEAEPEPPNAMQQPPRSPAAPLLPRRLLVRSAISGVIIAAGAFALFVVRLPSGVQAARGAAITAVIIGGIALTWAERAVDLPWRAVRVPRNATFWLVLAIVAATIPLAMLPGVAPILQISPINALDLAVACAISVVAIGWRAGGVRHPTGHAREAARVAS
ncbi:MAG: cation-translocating P-type ATPase [Kofleriaceae bacterium]